jgi:para-nitrobenzyl esterase
MFHTYFANFAKTGDPNGDGLPLWPLFDLAETDLMLFTLDEGTVMSVNPLAERLNLVETVANAQTVAAVGELVGTSWQLVQFQGGDDRHGANARRPRQVCDRLQRRRQL